MMTAFAQGGSALPVSTYLKVAGPGESESASLKGFSANSVGPHVSSARTLISSTARLWGLTDSRNISLASMSGVFLRYRLRAMGFRQLRVLVRLVVAEVTQRSKQNQKSGN